MSVIVIDYTQYKATKFDQSDSVTDRLNVATVLAPANYSAYLNTVTSGLFTIDRIYVWLGNWYEYDVTDDVGSYIYVDATGELYQVNESNQIVPVDVIPTGGASMFSNSPIYNYPNPPNVRRLITGIANNNVVPIGAFTLGTQFAATAAGIYSINVQCSSLPGRIIYLEIFDSLNGASLANAESMDVGLTCAANCSLALIPAQIIQFYVRATGQGNLNIELNVARLA